MKTNSEKKPVFASIMIEAKTLSRENIIALTDEVKRLNMERRLER